MDVAQIQLLLGLVLLLAVGSFFFKVTRRLAIYAIIGAFFLLIGFLAGIGATKATIQQQHPVCYEVIW